ncbi:MAG: outer membrane lipoprotein carrier protein LolA [Lysobacter sp.]|nr:outer membrane lipoprotein carrier protein LolA [Lysobacter sp.]
MRAERFLRAALLALALGAAPVQASDWTIARLMEALAANKASRATFNETRFLALLDRPLESSGELRFTPPGRLEKRTLAPGSETLVVDGDSVTVERLGKRYSLSLRDHPEVAVFVDSIRGTLAGDLKSLERAYTLSLEGREPRWRLVLRPRDAPVARLVESIEVDGAGADVRRIEITQPDGDRSLMLIRRVGP